MGTSSTKVSCGMGRSVCERLDEMGTTGQTAGRDGKSREYSLRLDGKWLGWEQDAIGQDSRQWEKRLRSGGDHEVAVGNEIHSSRPGPFPTRPLPCASYTETQGTYTVCDFYCAVDTTADLFASAPVRPSLRFARSHVLVYCGTTDLRVSL